MNNVKIIHDEADIIRYFVLSKDIFIFGTGCLSRYIIDVIALRKYNGIRDYIKAVLLRNKVQETFMGIKVYQADSNETNKDATVLMAVSSEKLSENIRYLKTCQYRNFIILSLEFENHCLLSPFAYKQRAFLQMDVLLTQHCNLNCKGCMSFAPIAKNEFLDFTEYKRDIERLSKLFYSEHELIQIMGGEPLLHPELEKFIEITRINFPYGQIRIVTNGLLLHKMSNSFWKTCQEYKIDIYPTKYPINYNYEKVQDIANRYGVKYGYTHGYAIKTLDRWPLNPEGNEDIENNFKYCRVANMCPALSHGKIYTCSFPPTVYHLNLYHDMKFRVSKKDGIDIYKVDTGEQIMEFISRPIPFCRYCNINNVTFGLPYETSKKEKDEWVD